MSRLNPQVVLTLKTVRSKPKMSEKFFGKFSSQFHQLRPKDSRRKQLKRNLIAIVFVMRLQSTCTILLDSYCLVSKALKLKSSGYI